MYCIGSRCRFALPWRGLLTPIAYQRGWDETDASRLWAADRVLVGGVGVQLAAGLVLLAGYLVWGSELVVLLTSEAFAVPAALVAILATGRFLQTLSQSLQPIFAVHHKMGSILWLRLVGAALTVGLCWPLTLEYGILGAAAGSCAAFALYLGILLFAPSGCFWLVLRARRGALAGEQV